MQSKKNIKNFFYILIAVSVSFAFFLSLFVSSGVAIVHAATSTYLEAEYSAVLDDLKKDSSFSATDYPYDPKDYSLQVLQVAESVDDELFVYVYQPSGSTVDLRATSINISKGYKTLQFFNYTLTYINSNETLYKYKVDDFQVEDTRVRYYDITSIYRFWNKDYGDSETGNDNTITEVPFNVSTIYKLGVENGEFVSESKPTDTIQVVSKYVGFVRYSDGFKLYKSACDSHFIAFSTDIPIDELQAADIYYTTQSYSETTAAFIGTNRTYGEKLPQYSYVTDSQEIQYVTDGWFNSGTINRDRVVKVADFIAGENFETVYSCGLFDVAYSSKITDEGINNLKQCEWVVRFAETGYFYSPAANNYLSRTIVGDVSILRLEGISNGEHFNLGVIDNKQSAGDDPINYEETEVRGNGIIGWLLGLIGLLLLIVLFVAFAPVLSPILGSVIKALIWLICLPFKALGALFKRKRE